MIGAVKAKVSHRKWRLFCCALCYGIWDQIADEDCRRAVTLTEKFADGLCSRDELKAACAAAGRLKKKYREERPPWQKAGPSKLAGVLAAFETAWTMTTLPDSILGRVHPTRMVGEADDAYRVRRRQWQKSLLVDVIGPLPFRPVNFSPEWRTDTALSLAQSIYDGRDFSAMPILADALQDAGCDNDDILSHCRDSHVTHVRGCWVVDLVLGKE
jgi:hypothetical protein